MLLRPWMILPLMVAAIWGGITWQLRDVEVQVLRATERDTANLARSVEQHIIRTIGSVDQALRFMQAAWRLDPEHFDLLRWSGSYLAGGGPGIQMAMIGPDGRLRASDLTSGATTAPVDLSDREHFRVHVGATEDRLFISRPVLGRVSQRYTIQLTRGLHGADGSFGGVIVISLDPALLSAAYESLELGAGSLMLVGRDGIIRAWAPQEARLVGQPVPQALSLLLQSDMPGHFRDAASLDGVDRFISFRPLDEYPLVVGIGVEVESALADFRWLRMRLSAAGVILSLAVLLVGPLLLRQRAQRARSEQALRDTLRGMDQGVVMSGTDGRVLVANARAGELLDLPPGMADRGPPSHPCYAGWATRKAIIPKVPANDPSCGPAPMAVASRPRCSGRKRAAFC